MKFSFDPLTNPNLTGEYLRNEFFVQNIPQGKLGGYNCKELKSDVHRHKDKFDDDIKIEVYSKNIDGILITMEYSYDGDLDLTFYFGKLCLNNDDAKKTTNWKFL